MKHDFVAVCLVVAVQMIVRNDQKGFLLARMIREKPY